MEASNFEVLQYYSTQVNRNKKKKDMALVNLAKFATFAFLICTMASPFGSGAEMVIKQVVTNIDENCFKFGEPCDISTDCCEGLVCTLVAFDPEIVQLCKPRPKPYPFPPPKQQSCAHKGQSCFPEPASTLN